MSAAIQRAPLLVWLLAGAGCGSVWGEPIVTGTASGSGSADGSSDDAGSSGGSPATSSWCDPSTWPDGIVPTASTDVVVPSGERILVDCDAEARTIEVQAGGELFAARDVATTLTVHGNFIVYGRVDWGTPDDRILDVDAEIVFADVRDEAFVGTPPVVVGDASGPTQLTPIDVVASDTGLWVLGEAS